MAASMSLVALVAAALVLVGGPGGNGERPTDDRRIAGESVPVPTAPPEGGPTAAPHAAPAPGTTGDPGDRRPGERWSAEVPGGAAPHARVVAGTVVTLGVDGTVTGRAIADGAPRWRTEVPQRPDRAADEVWDWYRQGQSDAPAQLPEPVAGTVVVRRGVHLAFLDATTGERLGAAHLPVSGIHLASSGPWVLTSDGDRIAAVGIPGTVAWDRTVPDGHQVALHGHGAYLRGQGEVARLVSNTGDEAWRTTVGASARVLAPVTARGEILIALDGADPALVALDPADGTERWRAPVAGSITEVAVGDDRLVVAATGDGEHRILVLAPDAEARFVVRRQLVLETDRIVQLALVGGQVVAVTGGRDPEVVLATGDGFVRHRHAATGPARIVAADTRTLLVADDLGVTALAMVTGQERFSLPLTNARLVPGSEFIFGGADGLVAVTSSPDPPRRGPCPRPGPGCAP